MQLGDSAMFRRLMSFENSMEPYAQLVRSLLPRAASVSLFDNTGKLLWTSAQRPTPTCSRWSRGHRAASRHDRDGVGQHCALPDDGPAYLFWLRDAQCNVAAVVAVVCNRRPGEADPLPFSYVHDHLKPALELLRRDLLARADIDQLNESLSARDKDLELLLSVTGSHPQRERLRRSAVAAGERPEPSQVRARRHRRARQGPRADASRQRRRQHPHAHAAPAARDHADAPRSAGHQPDRDAGRAGRDSVSHPRLPAAPGSGRTSGVLALFRKLEAPEFVDRDVHLADLRRAQVAASIETSYDAMSGLLTRAALEQRVRARVQRRAARARSAGACCTSTSTSCTSSTKTSACTSATRPSASSATCCASTCRRIPWPRASPATASRW